MYNKLQSCLKSIREKTDFKPEVGLVLGSGLGDFAETIKTEATVEYKDIEGFPVSTVKGHKGRFVFGYSGDIPVVIMQGRVHYYEGYTAAEVGRMMGAPTNTVLSWLRRARAQLHTMLKEEIEDEVVGI